jgi:hypothetical protein
MVNSVIGCGTEENTGMDELIFCRAAAMGKEAPTTPSVEWNGSWRLRERWTGMPENKTAVMHPQKRNRTEIRTCSGDCVLERFNEGHHALLACIVGKDDEPSLRNARTSQGIRNVVGTVRVADHV